MTMGGIAAHSLGELLMVVTQYCRLAVTAILLVLPNARVLAGPDAQDIAMKCKAVMTAVRTYQGTWQMSMIMGQMGSMSITMEMKAVPSSSKLYMTVKPLGTPSGMLAAPGASMNAQMIDDGKNLYKYDRNKNQYSKEPHRPNNSINPAEIWFRQAANSGFKIETIVKLNGRPTYVLLVVPKQGTGPAIPNTRIYVDQANYQFKQMTMSNTIPGGQGGQPQKMDVKLLVKSDRFNEPIPDSVFKFTPPPGAVEVQSGQLPMPMGGPMMGGPPGRARQ